MVLKSSAFFMVLVFMYACKSQPKTCTDCESTVQTGQVLYFNQCSSCHGADGSLGVSGAKDLSKSKMNNSQIKYILSEGKGAMPSQIELIGNPTKMDSVIEFVKQLRK